MLPDRVSNPGPLTYESGALPIALRGPAMFLWKMWQIISKLSLLPLLIWSNAYAITVKDNYQQPYTCLIVKICLQSTCDSSFKKIFPQPAS